MNKKGIVSTSDNINKKARVIFPDLDNNLSYELEIAIHVGELIKGDRVIVLFSDNNSMSDGTIIGKLR